MRATGIEPVPRAPGSADPRQAHDVEAATEEQADALADAMRPAWRMLVLLAAYCQLRFGELAELRRKDVDLDLAAGRGVIKIRRAMTRVDGELLVGPPKSAAGRRDVAVPPHLLASWPRTWPGTPDAAGTACCSPRREAASSTTR